MTELFSFNGGSDLFADRTASPFSKGHVLIPSTVFFFCSTFESNMKLFTGTKKQARKTKFVFLYDQKSHQERALDLSVSQTEIEDFIQNHLPQTSAADKLWNLQDARQRLAQGESVEALKQKYEFYDGIAVLRDQMLAHIPSEKRGPVLQAIQEIISVRTNGKGRDLKKEKIESIKQAVELFLQEQTLRRHKIWRTQHLPPLGVQVYKALLAEDAMRFKTEYENVFTKDFWSGIYGIFSKDFPNVVKSFPYPTENDFLSSFTHLDELKKFLENLKKSALADAKENVKAFFSEAEEGALLGQLNGIPIQKPADMVKHLHTLYDKKAKHQEEAKKSFESIQKLSREGYFEAAHSEKEALEKKFGKKAIAAMGGQRFIDRLMVDVAQERRLEKEAKAAKGIQKIKIEKKLESQRTGQENREAQAKLSQAEKEEKTKELNSQLEECLAKNDFTGARSVARRLQGIDVQVATKAIKRINEATKASSQETEIQKPALEPSLEKQKKIAFYEQCISHMKKVLEQCSLLGIPKDDPSFWGLEGVKNRVEWLRKNGLYETYKKFNASDPHVPSTAQAGGFRFRWLDIKTGPNLSGGSADAGVGFLKRFNESGYQLAVLAGAFSVNWKGGSDPVHAPGKVLQIIQGELGKVRGEK